MIEAWRAEEIEGVWYVARDGDDYQPPTRVRVTPNAEGKIDQCDKVRAERIAKILNALAG